MFLSVPFHPRFELDHYVASAVSVDWIDLKILTVSCSFFVAFYVNQCLLVQK